MNNHINTSVKSPEEITFELSSSEELRRSGKGKNIIQVPDKFKEENESFPEDKLGNRKERPDPGKENKDDLKDYPSEKREELELLNGGYIKEKKVQSRLNPETEVFTQRDPDETPEDHLKNRKHSDNIRNRNQPL